MDKTQLVTKNHEAFADTEITHKARRDGDETTCTVIWQDQQPDTIRDEDGVHVELRARCQILTDDVATISRKDTIVKDGEEWSVLQPTPEAEVAHDVQLRRTLGDEASQSYRWRK